MEITRLKARYSTRRERLELRWRANHSFHGHELVERVLVTLMSGRGQREDIAHTL